MEHGGRERHRQFKQASTPTLYTMCHGAWRNSADSWWTQRIGSIQAEWTSILEPVQKTPASGQSRMGSN